MKNPSYKILVFIIILMTVSCKKVINLKLGSVSGKLVIEGNITNQEGLQYIKLSKNVPLSSVNTYPPVTGATVTVNDGIGNTYQFKEDTAGTYSANLPGGFSGYKYKMSVSTGGLTYTATSEMPAFVGLDSVTSRNSDFSSGKNQREITVHFADPPGVPNQYNFLMYVNGIQVKGIFAFNDQFSDGRYVDLDLIENDIDIYPNDKVTIEMQCVDKPIYTYWFTLEQMEPNGPGGGVTPTNPPTNITPVTLGYFSAHTVQYQIITVK